MTNTIEVKIKNVYGKSNIYVASEHADAIHTLTGKKTLDYKDIEALKALGFEVKHVIDLMIH